MFRRVLASLTATLLVATGLVAAQVSEAPVAQAAVATTNSNGKYARQIYWLDWANMQVPNGSGGSTPATGGLNGLGVVTTPAARQVVNGAYIENEPMPGYVVRATIRNVQSNHIYPGLDGDLTTNNAVWAKVENPSYADIRGAWSGSAWSGYSTGTQISRLTPRRNGLGVKFDIEFSVTVNGVLSTTEFPDVIATDGENLNSNENIRFTTTGAVWRNIENVRFPAMPMWTSKTSCGADPSFCTQVPSSYPANGGFGTSTFGNFVSAPSMAVPLAMSASAQKISVNIQTTGAEDVLIGFIMNTDLSDAPTSTYGQAGHVLTWSTNHATAAPNSTDQTNQPAIVLNSEIAPYLGVNPPDAETAVGTPAWTADDNAGNYNGNTRKDELWSDLLVAGQTEPTACGAREYRLSVKTVNANGKTVAGWMDFNKNGIFDSGERASGVSNANSATLVWTNVPQLSGGDTIGSRFQIASNAGNIVNPTGLAVDGEVEDHLLTVRNCGITITKSASPTTVTLDNPTINYTFTVKNTGQVPLANVKVNDSQLVGSPFTVAASMAAGESITLPVKTRTLTAAEIYTLDNVVNTATASSTFQGNGSVATTDDVPVNSAPATATVTVDYRPSLTVTKSLDENNPANGDVLNYSIVVTNDGSATITGVTVDDPQLGGLLRLRGSSSTTTTLAPGAQAVFVGSKTLTQADRDSGNEFTNTATAQGTAPDGSPATGIDQATTPFENDPKIKITKSGPAELVGDTITYTFTVENTGNVSHAQVLFSDPKLGIVNKNVFQSPPSQKFVPGQRLTFTETYTVTAEDIRNGKVVNSATVSATPINPTESPISASSNDVETTIPQNPQLEMTKQAVVNHAAHGTGPVDRIDSTSDVVTYTFTVTNTGNLGVSDIKFTDAKLGISVPTSQSLTVNGAAATTLLPGQSGTFTKTYQVTQDDLDAYPDPLHNTASVTGTPVTNVPGVVLDPAQASVNVPVIEQPDFKITKAAIAIANADDPSQSIADGSVPRKVGDKIAYQITAENTGNVSLRQLTYADPLLGIVEAPFPDLPVAPGGTRSVTLIYTVTQEDVDRGEVRNTATAKLPTSTEPKESNEVTVPTDSSSTISLDKVGTLVTANADGIAAAGDRIQYTLTVTNTGTTTVMDPVVTDAKLDLENVKCVPQGGSTSPVQLMPGQSCEILATYILTQADVDARTVDNTADVSATAPDGSSVFATDSATVDTIGEPALTLDKKATNVQGAGVGQQIPYTFDVVNTGTVTLDDVTVTDPLYSSTQTLEVKNSTVGSPRFDTATLAPGETGTATFTYTVTQQQLNAGTIHNEATATGTVPPGYDAPQAEDTLDTSVQGIALIEVEKTGTPTPATITAAGESITYTFTVTNTGSLTVSAAEVADPLNAAGTPLAVTNDVAASANVGTSTLAPGETGTAEFTYVVTQDDVDAGFVSNTATANATSSNPAIPVPEAQSNEVVVPIDGTGSMAVHKALKAGQPQVTAANEKLVYVITVTNTGTVSLHNVEVADPAIPGLSTPTAVTPSDMLPGQSGTIEVEYTVTQADINRGSFTNTANATATEQGGEAIPPTTSNPVVVTFPAQPSWDISKTGSLSGETITWQFTVTNTGNVSLNDVVVDDPSIPFASTPIDGLEPGQNRVLSATQTVTQAHKDAGVARNNATATATPERGEGPTDPPTASAEVPINAPRALAFEKDAALNTALAFAAAGDTIDYTFTVENTGQVSYTSMLLSDSRLGVEGLDLLEYANPQGTLAPGSTVSHTISYVLTQEDIDAGEILNDAAVSGYTAVDSAPTNDTDDATVELVGNPEITLTKRGVSVNLLPLTQANQPLLYTIEVTNTGTVTVFNPRITDQKLGLSNVTPTRDGQLVTELAPGESALVTHQWSITQGEVDARQAVNQATVTADVPPAYEDQGPLTQTADVQVPIVGTVALQLEKSSASVSGEPITEAGQVVRYTLRVTNSGSTTLDNAVVSDPMNGPTPLTVVPSILAPGQSGTATFDHHVTLAEVESGLIANTATATATPPTSYSGTATDTDTDEIPVQASPQLTLDKESVLPDGAVSAAGQVIAYRFKVTNTGNVTVNDIVLTDAKLNLTGDPVTASLAPGESTIVTRNYTVTQADADAQEIENTATVTGTPISGTLTPAQDTEVTDVLSTSSFTSTKSAQTLDANGAPLDPSEVRTLEHQIRYTITVHNTGTTSLYNPKVKDALYQNGDVALDACLNGVADPCVTVIEPGESASAQFFYQVTQADLDNPERIIVNVAKGSAEFPVGNEIPDEDDPWEPTTNVVHVPVDALPALSIQKTLVGTPAPLKVGDPITYAFTVINTGEVTVDGVEVVDPLLGEPLTVSPTSLVPQASGSAQATYEVTQQDVDRGYVENQANATGTPVNGGDPYTSPDSNPVTVLIPRNDDIAVVKEILAENEQEQTSVPLDSQGDKIVYRITVTNTGNTTLSDMEIMDEDANIDSWVAVEGAEELLPGQSATYDVVYTLTQDDVDAGLKTNIAQARATGKTTDPEEESNEVESVITGTAGLELEKSGSAVETGVPLEVGDQVEYTFTVTNTGTRTMNGVRVEDLRIGPEPRDADPSTLAPGQTGTVKMLYTVTQDDVDAGRIVNIASTTGTPTGDNIPTGPIPSNEHTLGLEGVPAITVNKTIVSEEAPQAAEDVIAYEIKVTNSGEITLTDAVVEDPGADTTRFVIPGEFVPGQEVTFQAYRTVTQADIDAGTYLNVATATAQPVDPQEGEPRETVTSSAQAEQPISRTSSFEVTKDWASATDVTKAGDTVTFTVTLTNTGNTTLSSPSFRDEMYGPDAVTLTGVSIAPEDDYEWSFDYTVTQDDVDAGFIHNTAIATAFEPGSDTTLPPLSAETEVPVKPVVLLSVVKDSAFKVPTENGKAGDIIVYSFTVTNEGSVSVTQPVISDARINVTDLAVDVALLKPGQSAQASAEYVVTQEDIDAGQIVNTAMATGRSVGREPKSSTVDSNEEITTFESIRSFEVRKSAVSSDGDALIQAGQEIRYTLTIQNTGDVTLTDAKVSDPKVGIENQSVTPSELAPGQEGSFSFDYTVTQADVEAGEVLNVASGTAVPPREDSPLPPVDSPEIVTPINGVMDFTAIKRVDLDSSTDVTKSGHVITYFVDVTNTGSLTLSNVQVRDPKIAEAWVDLGGGDLLPGESRTLTFPYTVTQADMDAGKIVNTAYAKAAPAQGGEEVEKPTNTITVDLAGAHGISVIKERVSEGFPSLVGDVIEYDVTVVNTGALTLSDFMVEDAGSDEKTVTVAGPLAPGEETTVTVHHTVTQADLDSGTFRNVASVPGVVDPGDGDSNPVDTPILQEPSIEVVKESQTAGALKVVGDTVDYTVTVTNTGNVTLTDVMVTDPLFGPDPQKVSEELAPGASAQWTFTYAITQADVDQGLVRNVATGSATPPQDAPAVPDTPSNEVINTIEQSPLIKLQKEGVMKTTLTGKKQIVYTLTLTNAGNTTLTEAQVTDERIGVLNAPVEPSTLAPGESGTAEFTYDLTAADVKVGKVENVATGQAQTPTGELTDVVDSNKVVIEIELSQTGSNVVGMSAGVIAILLAGVSLKAATKKKKHHDDQ